MSAPEPTTSATQGTMPMEWAETAASFIALLLTTPGLDLLPSERDIWDQLVADLAAARNASHSASGGGS